MLTVRKRTDDLLVLGMSRPAEQVLLGFFVGGLFLIGICLAADKGGGRVILALLMGIPTALVGFPIFYHEQLIVDRCNGLIMRRRPFRKPIVLRFEEIDHVELLGSWPDLLNCEIALKTGSRQRIARGPEPDLISLAKTLATFVRVPLHNRRKAGGFASR